MRNAPISTVDSRTLPLRLLFAVALLGVVYALRWANPPLPDFQVWVGADALAGTGVNPYDIDALNTELASDPEYGPWWQDEPERFRVRFFNPPMWLAILWIGQFSPFLVSFAGLVMIAGSLVALSRPVDDKTFAGYVLATAVVLLSPLANSSFSFGQTGLLLAGLVGVRLVLADQHAEGVPVALLSFKPHIALAAFLPSLISKPGAALQRLLPPAVLVMVLTVLLYGTEIVQWWVEALAADDGTIRPIDDMTLRTLSQRWPLPAEWSLFTLAAAFVVIVAVAQKLRTADRAVLTLFSIALAVFLSGHAFVHDWLWMVFIPVVKRWDLTRSVVGVLAVVVVDSLTRGTVTQPYAIVSSPSVVALAIVLYLGVDLVRSNRSTEPAVESIEELV